MMTADQRQIPTCSFKNTTDMMVTKEGSRKISAKASAMERWVNAVTLPTAPVPHGEKADDPQRPVGRLHHIHPAVITLADEGQGDEAEQGAEEGRFDRRNLTFYEFNAGIAPGVGSEGGKGEQNAFQGLVGHGKTPTVYRLG